MPKPTYQGIIRVAELIVDVNTSAGDGRLSVSLDPNNPGLGYLSPPKVIVDNFGTNGTGFDCNITQDLIDPIMVKSLVLILFHMDRVMHLHQRLD